MLRRRIAVAVCAGCALLAPGVAAMAKDKPTTPGHIEDGVLDGIDLRVEKIEQGIPVVIRTFPTNEADLGTGEEGGKEKRVRAVEIMKDSAPGLFKAKLASELKASGVFGEIIDDDSAPVPDNAIVVEGKFVMINPGSRAKRYWVGFSAGKSGVGVEGRVTSATGEELATFRHRKHSGIGIGGGDYVKFMSDDTEDVASDISKFLAGWATGKDLSKD